MKKKKAKTKQKQNKLNNASKFLMLLFVFLPFTIFFFLESFSVNIFYKKSLLFLTV